MIPSNKASPFDTSKADAHVVDTYMYSAYFAMHRNFFQDGPEATSDAWSRYPYRAVSEPRPHPAALDLQREGVQQGGGEDHRRAAALEEARAAVPEEVPLRAGAGPPRHDEGQPVADR